MLSLNARGTDPCYSPLLSNMADFFEPADDLILSRGASRFIGSVRHAVWRRLQLRALGEDAPRLTGIAQ